MAGKEVFTFDEAAVNAIVESVRQVKREVRELQSRIAATMGGPSSRMHICKVGSSSIPGMTVAGGIYSPGEGEVLLQKFTSDDTLSATTFSRTVFNISGKAIEANTYGIAWQELISGRFVTFAMPGVIRFELLGTLSLGGYADARQLVWDGSAYVTTGSTIVVKDFTDTPGSWRGTIGYQGWAWQPPDSDDGRYEIVWMETLARRIRFMANEVMGATTPGQMEATVTGWSDGKQPPSTVIVTDENGHWTLALNGSEGWATYNERTNFYEIDVARTKAEWVRGTTTANVVTGETDDVTVDDWGGAVTATMHPDPSEEGITLHDKFGWWGSSLPGAKAFGKLDKALDDYIMLLADSQAGVVEFTLSGSTSGGSASAAVNRWYGSLLDTQDPGSTITVYDGQGAWSRGVSGGKGLALFDRKNNKYWIVYCQQVGITATATLSANLTGGSTASISGFTITSPSPFNLSPSSTPTSANNPYAHRGLSGAAVQLVLNGSNWVVVDVAKVTAQFPLLYSGTGPLRLNADKLQGYMVDVAIELGATPTWVDLLDYTTECE